MNFILRWQKLLILLLVFGATVVGVSIEGYPTGGVVTGQTYTITYSPGGSTATTFVLRKGPSTDLGTVATLTTSATGGTFQWTVPRSLASGNDYVLEVRQGSEVNYSGQFSVSGQSSGAISSVLPPPVVSSAVQTPSPTPTPTPQPSPTPPASTPSTSNAAQSSGLFSAPASSIASGSGVSRSTGTSTQSMPVSQPSSSATVVPPSGGGGLSTGAKAGIGVGATIAGLFLALGAFFLGMSVHKKSKKVDDAETGTDGGKPELEGEGTYKHEITPEMEAGMNNPPEQDHHGAGAFGPPTTANELQAHPTPVVVPTQSELHGTPQHAELSPGVTQEPRHELYGNATYDQSPVSPISDAQHSGLNLRDTYDDPRLVQNPWAQNDTLPR